jgi:hypothetical protein
MSERKKDLIHATESVAQEYKEKPYEELKRLIDSPDCFSRVSNLRSYAFEVESKQITENTISIRVEGRRIFSFGYAIYFAKDVQGKVIENVDSIAF